MDNLNAEIRRLASEIRTVEKMLVEVYGLTPVTRGSAMGGFANWAASLRSLCEGACQRLARLRRNETVLALHIPHAD